MGCRVGCRVSYLWLVLCLVAPTLAVAESVAPNDRFIVRFSRDAVRELRAASSDLAGYSSDQLIDGMEQLIGGTELKELPSIDAAVLEIKPGSLNEALAQELLEQGVIDFIEPDYLVSIGRTPNDPQLSTTWGLHNTGQNSGTADIDIDGPDAWDTITDAGNLVVGVVDTGIDYNHPDLRDNMWVNTGEIASNGIDDDANGVVDDIHGLNAVANNGNPFDDNNHGTHCAGTIGGVGNNGIGVAGVAWRVKLMALKFLSASGSGYTSDAIETIAYAVQMKQRGVNLRVLSNSWGGGGFSQSLETAISQANQAGIIFIAAAGNSARNNDSIANYPSNYALENVVSVAALDRNGNLASFSNYGATKVHVGAPGVAVYSTVPNNSYASFNGTSMATPHISGIAALIMARNPSYTPVQVRAVLISATKPIAALNGKMVAPGIVSAYRALTGDPNLPPSLADIRDQGIHQSLGFLEIPIVAADPNNDPITLTATVSAPADVTATISQSTLRLTPRTGFLGSVTVTVRAADNSRYSEDSFTFRVHQNQAPVVGALPNKRSRKGGSISQNPLSTDPEGDTLTAEVRITPSSAATGFAYYNFISITGAANFVGVAQVEYAVSDSYSTTSRVFTVTFEENLPPVIEAAPFSIRPGERKWQTIALSDPNGDSLSGSVVVNPSSAATGYLYTNAVYLIADADLAPGSISISLRASDGAVTTTKDLLITVVENQPPTLTSIPQQVGVAGSGLWIPYTVNDPDGDSVTFRGSISTRRTLTGQAVPTLNIYSNMVLVNIPVGWRDSFYTTITVSDGKLEASRSFLVVLREVGQVGADADGDGVSDDQETSDGTDANDRGSFLPRLEQEVCAEWNGFLGGMWNIQELVNRSSQPLKLLSTLYDIDGQPRGQREFEIPGGQQFDLAVHDLEGWTRDSYGKVCNTILSAGMVGALDGRMVYYKPAVDGGFQFAFAMPFQSGLRGEQFVFFNTFQPSMKPADAANPVANWIQLSNLEGHTQSGELVFYDMEGMELGRESVQLPAGGRRDYSAHRFGASRVGQVQWKPEGDDARVQLRNVRYAYDNTTSRESFAGAFQLEGALGSGRELSAPVDTSIGSAIVEIGNTLAEVVNVQVRVFDEQGTLKADLVRSLPPHASWHLIADNILNGGRGSVIIRGSEQNSIVGTVMQYGRSSEGAMLYLYGIQAKEPLQSTFRGSYNTFLNQGCELMLVNPTTAPVYAVIEMKNYLGEYVLPGRNLTVPAHGMHRESLCHNDSVDRYGVVTVYGGAAQALNATLIRVGENSSFRFPTPVR